MTTAYIVDAVRTPVGRRGGSLAGIHSADLGAHVISALIERTGVDPGAVDDVIFGCTDTLGSQAGDIARTAWLVAGTARPRARRHDRPPVRFQPAGRALRRAGRHVRHRRPDRRRRRAEHVGHPDLRGHDARRASTASRRRSPSRPGGVARYGDQEVSQFRSAEMIAEKWNITREAMEEFALREPPARDRAPSTRGASRARSSRSRASRQDEGPRRDTSLEKMAGLAPLTEGGRDHGGRRLADHRRRQRPADRLGDAPLASHGLTPRARIHHISVRADDPVWMLTGPIRATQLRTGAGRHDRR